MSTSLVSRRRVWEIVEAGRPGDSAARAVAIGILTLIFLNVLAVILGSVRGLERRFSSALAVFEAVSVGIFTLEYLARLWSCVEDARFANPLTGRARFIVRPFPLIDLLAILPFFLSFAAVDLRFLRAVRLLRLVRLAKAARYVAALDQLKRALRAKREELILTSGLMLLLLVLASSLMYVIENEAQPEKFSSIPASMWWAVSTLTTVGYGDVYPVTQAGRFLGAIIAILGIGFFALPTAIVGSGFVEAIQSDKAPATCPHCGKSLS